MSDLHIDDFYKDIARIFNHLYRMFPRKGTLYVEDISGADEPDEFGLHSNRHMACLGAMIWLAEEGFIRYEDTIRQEAVDQAVLSARTFTLLSSVCTSFTEEEFEDFGEGLPYPLQQSAQTGFGSEVPSSVLQAQRTNINRLRRALKSRSSDRIRAVVHDVLYRGN